MHKVYNKAYFLESVKVPDYLIGRVMETPRLLPGERREDYFLFFEAMLRELVPNSDLEWLLCIELTWIMWDIQRLRRWKNAIVVLNQRPALEEALRQTDPAYSLHPPTASIRAALRKKVDAAGGDWKRSGEFIDQLEKAGYDDEALNAAAFLESAAALATVEKFLASASHQFHTMLKEAAVRGEFKLRAQQARNDLLAQERLLTKGGEAK